MLCYNLSFDLSISLSGPNSRTYRAGNEIKAVESKNRDIEITRNRFGTNGLLNPSKPLVFMDPVCIPNVK